MYTIFHALGKFLYNKSNNADEGNDLFIGVNPKTGEIE